MSIITVITQRTVVPRDSRLLGVWLAHAVLPLCVCAKAQVSTRHDTTYVSASFLALLVAIHMCARAQTRADHGEAVALQPYRADVHTKQRAKDFSVKISGAR